MPILSSQEPLMLHANSIKQAVLLKDFLSQYEDLLSSDTRFSFENGIVIGKGEMFLLSNSQENDIHFWLDKHVGSLSVPLLTVAFQYKKLLLCNSFDLAVFYRIGEYIAIQDSDRSNIEWVMKINNIFTVGPYSNKYFTFVDGQYFKAQISRTT